MKRRDFIGIAAAGAASVLLPASACGKESARSTLAMPRLLAIIRNDTVVRELGQRYRERVAGENDGDALAALILEGPPEAHASGSPVFLRQRLNEQVTRDFAAGRTVTLDGWILAVTEARQCALYSLLSA